MRVYIPATTVHLATLHGTGAFEPVSGTAFAVTPGLREWYVDDDIEELEYAAAADAAQASLRLIDADPSAGPRRVVLAADVPDSEVSIRDDLDRGVVRLTGPVPLSAIASIHVDEREAEATIRAASEAIVAADLGDESAQEQVDDAEGYELLWYATQELGDLLDQA